MNERIRELAEQAWDSTRDEIGSFVDDGGEVNWDFLHTYDKKFAELIVRECAYAAAMFSIENKRIHPDIDPQTMPLANRMIYHSTCQSVAREIIEHFGIEE